MMKLGVDAESSDECEGDGKGEGTGEIDGDQLEADSVADSVIELFKLPLPL